MSLSRFPPNRIPGLLRFGTATSLKRRRHTIGTTGLNNLRIDCVIGVYPHERTDPQPLFVDVEVDYDFAPAADTDDLAGALDYDQIATGLTSLAQEGRFALLETLVEAAATFCLQSFPAVTAVRLEIRKPRAVEAADASFVRIERRRT